MRINRTALEGRMRNREQQEPEQRTRRFADAKQLKICLPQSCVGRADAEL